MGLSLGKIVVPNTPRRRRSVAAISAYAIASMLVASCGGNAPAPPTPVAVTARVSTQGHPLSDTWSTKAPMPTPEFGPASIEAKGSIFVMGGASTVCCYQNVVQAYDSLKNSWSVKAPMSTPRQFFGVGNINGILYAVGGFGQSGVLNTLEAFNPRTNVWTNETPMPTARAELVVRVVNGMLYAIGGYAQSGSRRHDNQTLVALDVVEAYSPATNAWLTKAHMLRAHAGAAAAESGNLYVIGGMDASNHYSSVVEEYNPATDTWSLKAPMPTARYDLAAGNINGLLYAVGGWGSAGVLNTVEAYNPFTNTWVTKPPMPTARYGLTVRGVNNSLYALGGRDGNQVTLSTVEAYAR